MNQFNPQTVSPPFSSRSDSTLQAARWLLVLVPSVAVDLTIAVRRICELANAGDKRVRFVGLYEDTAHELSLRRQLAHISALVATTRVYTETELIYRKNPLDVIRALYQPGDILICFTDKHGGFFQHPGTEALMDELHAPVYLISIPDLEVRHGFKWQTSLFAWAGSLGLIAGFFLIQIRIDQLVTNWAHIPMVLLSILLEIWMIYVWNILFK